MECVHTTLEKDQYSVSDGYCPFCLKDEVDRLQEKVDQQAKFIADTADNYIDLCRQLGTHRPLGNTGCFGSTECLNCFRVGFAVLAAAKVRNTQLIQEKGEDEKLITQYRKRLQDVSIEVEKLKAEVLVEKEGHGKTAKQYVDATALIGCLEIKIEKLHDEYDKTRNTELITKMEQLQSTVDECNEIRDRMCNAECQVNNLDDEARGLRKGIEMLEATLDPVRDWYDGDGRITDNVLMLGEAIADLQKDRKELLRLTAEVKSLCTSHSTLSPSGNISIY